MDSCCQSLMDVARQKDQDLSLGKSHLPVRKRRCIKRYSSKFSKRLPFQGYWPYR